MNKQEAINVLAGLYRIPVENGADKFASEINKAIDMAIEALQRKSINCNYTCSDCVHQNKAYEEEPCHSCFNNNGAGYVPNLWEAKK